MKDINPALQETTRSHVLNYLQLVWFRRRLVLTVTVIMAILGVAWLSQAPPQYVSSSSLRIGMPISDGEAREQTSSVDACLLYTSPSPRDVEESRMPSSA